MASIHFALISHTQDELLALHCSSEDFPIPQDGAAGGSRSSGQEERIHADARWTDGAGEEDLSEFALRVATYMNRVCLHVLVYILAVCACVLKSKMYKYSCIIYGPIIFLYS